MQYGHYCSCTHIINCMKLYIVKYMYLYLRFYKCLGHGICINQIFILEDFPLKIIHSTDLHIFLISTDLHHLINLPE